MAIKNPILEPVSVGRMEDPARLDDRAMSRGIENLAKAGREYLVQKETGKMNAALEAERAEFLASEADEIAGGVEDAMALLDGSFKDDKAPSAEEINAFTNKMLKLAGARAAGGISETELKIRQEKILREAIANKPWMADELVRAASFTQGYNPIGSEVQAMAAARDNEAARQRKFFDQITGQMIQAGVPAYLLASNPDQFFAHGIQLTQDLMKLASVKTMADTLANGDKIDTRQAQAMFDEDMIGVMATLPGAVQGLVNQFSQAMESGAFVNNPQLEASYRNRLAAMQAEYAVGGTKYRDMFRAVKERYPNLDVSAFDAQWKNRVEPMFTALGKAGNGEEIRAATNFYVSGPWRQALVDNPRLAVTTELMKAAGAAMNTPGMQLFSYNLSNHLVKDMAPILAGYGLQELPNGDVRVNPEVDQGSLGRKEDEKGDLKAGEAVRRGAVATARSLLGNADNENAANQGLVALAAVGKSYSNRRSEGFSRPSTEARLEFLNTLASPEFRSSVKTASPLVKLKTGAILEDELTQVAGDIMHEIRLKARASSGLIRGPWENEDSLRYIQFIPSGDNVKAVPLENLPAQVRRSAEVMAGQINTQYRAELEVLASASLALRSMDVHLVEQPGVSGSALALKFNAFLKR